MGSDDTTVKAAVLKLKTDGDAAVNVVCALGADVTAIMKAANELVTDSFERYTLLIIETY